MALIIQKFGGTSLADTKARKHLLAKVRQTRDHGDLPVLVVSAMGRRGAPYATDTLLELLRDFDPKPDSMISDLLVSCGETISACLIATLLRREGIPAVPMTAYTARITADGPFGDAVPTGVDADRFRSSPAFRRWTGPATSSPSAGAAATPARWPSGQLSGPISSTSSPTFLGSPRLIRA
jgi:aspartokinase